MGLGKRWNNANYARLHRLLTQAREEAQALGSVELVHLTNMALMQTVVAWEGISLEQEPDARLGAVMREKARICREEARANIVSLA